MTNKTISNEDKAREYCNCKQCSSDSKCVCVKFNTFMKAAQWKDEQSAEQKQQVLEKAIKLMQHWILEHDYVDIMELENYIKQQMEEHL